MDFEKLLEQWKIYYYSQLIMALFEITALVLAIIYMRKYKIGKLFILYIAFDFCIFLIDSLLVTNVAISKNLKSIFVGLSNTTIALIELLVYYYYFSQVLHNRNIKKALILISLVFTVIVFIHLATRFYFITNRFTYVTNLIGVMEFILLLTPCIFYFFQLFKNISGIPLSQRPSFWIVTGIFLFSIISIPFYLTDSFIHKSHLNYYNILAATLFYLPFSINFIFLSKAFLCKKPLTI